MENKLILGTLALLSIFVVGGLAGCLGGEVVHEVNNFNFDITISATDNSAEIQVISGDGDWADYEVTVDITTELTTTTTSFGAGNRDIFTDPTSTWDPAPGTNYKISIKDIGDDALIYQETIMATA